MESATPYEGEGLGFESSEGCHDESNNNSKRNYG